MKNNMSNIKLIISLILFVGFSINSAIAQQIKGVIVADDGTLPGVIVKIDSLKLGTATDLDGAFVLQNKTEGKYQLTISYMGYNPKTIGIDIKSGINDLGTILLETNDLVLGEVVVRGTMAPSQAKAYNIKRSAPGILDVVASDAMGKLPDRNVAEAVQRIQGVAVARYHGEADQATVRGTPFAWTSTLFNDSRLPSSNVMGNRSTVLDVIPSELIQYVEVAKALTPDWEADAIGGSINFRTRTAPQSRKLGVSLAGGYNNFSDNATYNASLIYGDRFLNNKLGVMLVGAIWDRQWGSDSYDVKYNTALTDPTEQRSINNVLFKRYMGKRQTYGINLGLEYKFNDSHKIFFKGLYDQFNDVRPVYESYIDYNKSSYQYNYRYSYYQTHLTGGEVGGEHQLSQKFIVDWSVSDYTSDYFLDTPSTSDTKGLPIATFYQPITGGFNNLSSDGKRYWGFDSPNGVGGNPLSFDPGLNNLSEVMDPEKLILQQLVISKLDTKEQDRVFQTNMKFEPSSKLKFKFGGKYRTKTRDNTYGYNKVYAGKGQALSEMDHGSFPMGNGFFTQMNGNYDQFIVDPLTKQQLFTLFSQEYLDKYKFADYSPKTNPTNIYRAFEDVIAVYGMVDVELAPKLRFIGGIRNEYTLTTLKGSAAEKNGTETIITPARNKNNYNAFSPMLHLKYSINDKSNLRAAFTRTFVRPSFGDMSPGEIIDQTANPITISKGNQNIKPTFANNFDLMGEYFFDNIGIVSGGFFYKKIKDVIFKDQSYYMEDGQSYIVSQSKNLENARLFGFEAGINKRFDFLNGFWSGFGLELNYTYIDSKVTVPRTIGTGSTARTIFDKTGLPDQSKNMGNVILFYERNGVMIRLAGNYRGESVNTINQQLGPDFYVWTANNFTLDASASVSITKQLKVFVELNNLTNEPLKQYMGDSRRLTSAEWYGTKGQIGLRFDVF